jgi:sensitive to high expression protein 9
MAVERRAEEAGAKLSACILARYHEEQIWSDKIRRMSTWGTWGLMGVNILLFLLFQVAVEPWRRKRLVKGFEDKVMEALEREGSAGATLAEMNAAKDLPAPADIVEESQDQAQVVEETLPEPQGAPQEPVLQVVEAEDRQIPPQPIPRPPMPVSTLESVRERIRDMFSERHVTVRRVDLTTAMMEGAAAGVAFVGLLVLLLRPS